jgi:general secretion pathway protein D
LPIAVRFYLNSNSARPARNASGQHVKSDAKAAPFVQHAVPCVARRRSELNATPMRTILLVAFSFITAQLLIAETSAAPASGSGSGVSSQASPQEVRPMTRDDVEILLREARSAIAKGNLDEAETLVSRAEKARVRYSMLHMGPTPASVRRELNKARNAAGKGNGSPRGARLNPFATGNKAGQQKETVDPFLEAKRLGRQGSSTPLPQQSAQAEAFAKALETPAGAPQKPQRLPATAAQEPTGSAITAKADGTVAPAAYEGAEAAPGAKSQAMVQMTEARQALDAGNIDLAEKLSHAASSLNVPESQFSPNEDRPSLVAGDVAQAKQRQEAQQAVLEFPDPSSRYAQRTAPPAQNGDQPADAAAFPPPSTEELPPPQGEPNSTPPASSDPGAAAMQQAIKPPASLIEAADEATQTLARQLYAEIGKRQSEAIRMREKDPERALAILREGQQLVTDSKLPETMRAELTSRVDKTLKDTEKYMKDHGAELELEKQNEAALAARDRDRELQRKIKQEIADGVEEFNRLRDEHRYAEGEIVARRLMEIAPDDPTVQQIFLTAKFIRREMMNRELSDRKEEGNYLAMDDVEQASVTNVGDEHPLVFDPVRWRDLTQKRKGFDERTRRSPRELEIEKQLKTPVQLRYEDTPLSQVINELSNLTGVNIHLDPRGLSQEDVNSDTAVTLNLTKEISLQSALNLILEPLHLSYVVKDDVLKITSEQLRDGELETKTYNVADLVVPIPNFVPSSNIGLQGLINESMSSAHNGRNAMGGGASVLVNDRKQPESAASTDNILAQQFNPMPATGGAPATVPIGGGPGGMGAGANADFDSLIDLIVSTVSTETWAENGGGEAEIRPFPTNLSLVISQTQAVHEEIADLLAQLRRLQDLQVTIEVRFIRLNDNFFERIGIDFDMDVNDNGFNDDPATTPLQPFGPNSNTVGVVRPTVGDLPAFTTDLDIPFRQNSFELTQVVPFGGPVSGGLNFGFAILSDLEAYFLIEAAQGDRRTNVLNAPKVTLFNGQQAFVADATQRPFVVGVIPVVGEFAAAQQPVIVVLNEGTMMTIQAVVSEDRRYVRMTIVPFFTQIGDVDEFTFEGTSSSSSSSSATDDDDDGKNEEESEEEQETRSGVTVQLPSLSFVSVVTTVSVPDGGTVLLGGIKRLAEGRNEWGVPLLSKVPYINRLFRNIAIGRETESLMMMVTPRIIIQEEEEERLGIAVP